jgi:hypothetical protein
MKRIAAVVLTGALVTLFFNPGYSKSLAEWLVKPGGSAPVITHSFASEKLSPGDIWRIYLEANDPDGDMRRFVCVFNQVGYGPYSAEYVIVKKQYREKMKGYLYFLSTAGAGLRMPEWTQLKLTLYIQDKGGNSSNKVEFPLVLSRGARQESPPAPFDSGQLAKLGAISVELVNPQEDGNGGRYPLRHLFH